MAVVKRVTCDWVAVFPDLRHGAPCDCFDVSVPLSAA
jgi:hypothetical protein